MAAVEVCLDDRVLSKVVTIKFPRTDRREIIMALPNMIQEVLTEPRRQATVETI